MAALSAPSHVVYQTKANHMRGSLAMGGTLYLEGGRPPSLLFQAHGIFQRRYEFRVPIEQIAGAFVSSLAGPLSSSLTVAVEGLGAVAFVVPGRSEWQTRLSRESLHALSVSSRAAAERAFMTSTLVQTLDSRPRPSGRNLLATDGLLHTYHEHDVDWRGLWAVAASRHADIPSFAERPFWIAGGPGGSAVPLTLAAFWPVVERMKVAADVDIPREVREIFADDPDARVRDALARSL